MRASSTARHNQPRAPATAQAHHAQPCPADQGCRLVCPRRAQAAPGSDESSSASGCPAGHSRHYHAAGDRTAPTAANGIPCLPGHHWPALACPAVRVPPRPPPARRPRARGVRLRGLQVQPACMLHQAGGASTRLPGSVESAWACSVLSAHRWHQESRLAAHTWLSSASCRTAHRWL